MQRFKESKGGIIIEDDVWIGANCAILDGSIIRKGAVIGANSLVYGEMPEYSVCVGSPARKIGERK
jgi:acetyltransferase-like isoleucine patch superfamily enzyme